MSTGFPITMAVLSSILAAAFMAASHYLAPRITGRDLRPVEAYAIGVGLGILGPFALWCGLVAAFVSPVVNVWTTAAVLAGIIIGAGWATVACYLLDWAHGHRVTQ